MNTQHVDYAHYIDHTLLAMDATEEKIIKLCHEAREYHFYAVCVNSGYVPLAKEQLSGSDVKVCSVIGFPLGSCLTSVKVFEAKAAIEAGAQEIDMVINVGWLKSGKIEAVRADIEAVYQACGKTPLKVILETCLLEKAQIIELCQMCREIGVAFVKTSTGFSSGGADVDDVKLMHDTAGPTTAVKASGGIRDRATALAMIKAGATRIGTSSGIAIVTDQTAAKGSY